MTKENKSSNAPWQISILVTILVAFIGITPQLISAIRPQSNNSKSKEKENEVTFNQDDLIKVKFECDLYLDDKSKDQIYTTFVNIENKLYPFIYWKSEYFSRVKWTPQERCTTVTKRLETFHKNENFNIIKVGILNDYNVLCVVDEKEFPCNDNNLLITLQEDDEPQKIRDEFFEARKNPGFIISRDKGSYIIFKKYIENLVNNSEEYKKFW